MKALMMLIYSSSSSYLDDVYLLSYRNLWPINNVNLVLLRANKKLKVKGLNPAFREKKSTFTGSYPFLLSLLFTGYFPVSLMRVHLAPWLNFVSK